MAIKRKPTIAAPTPEELTKFIASENLPRIPTPRATPGLQLPGVTPTSSSPSNIVPQVNGNVGVENRGTSATSPLISSTGGLPEVPSPVPGIGEPVRPPPQEPSPAGFKQFGIDVLNLLPGINLEGGGTFGEVGGGGPRDIQPDPSRAAAALAPTTSPTAPGSFVTAADRPLEPAPIEPPPAEGGPVTAEQLRDAILGDDLNQKILLGSQVEPTPTFTTGTLTEFGLEGFPIFGGKGTPQEGQIIGSEPIDPQEQLEATKFLERRNLRAILQAASLDQVASASDLAAQQAESEAFAITLSPQVQTQIDSGELSTNLAASSKRMSDIMFMETGPDQVKAAFEFAAEPVFEVALGMRWDTQEQAFVTQAGISAESQDPRVKAYHAKVKGWYAQRDQVLQLVDIAADIKKEQQIHAAQVQNITDDKNRGWSEGDLERLQQLELETAEVNLQILKDTRRDESRRELATIVAGGPNSLVLARMSGLLSLYEKDLGVSLTFGRNLDMPLNGEMPGPEQYLGMGEFEKFGSMVSWMENTGMTMEDFIVAFRSQLPGVAIPGTRVSVI